MLTAVSAALSVVVKLPVNTDEIHWQRGLKVQSIHEHFADPLLSFEIGHCKPDADFFNKGLQRLSVSPEECVFLDDREENVESARGVGLTALHFQSRQQAESELQSLGLL